MLYFDEDSDARFFMPEAGTMTTGDLDAMLANLGQTKIGCLIVGVNGQMSNFRSKFVESYLDRFDPAGGITQSAMRGSREKWAFRRVANMAVMERQGVDTNAYLLEGARKLGREAWIDVRMNDIHDGHDENAPIHASLWREHPELRIPGALPGANGYDFSQQTIRDMMVNYIAEANDKYRPGNVILDWMRWPSFLPRGREEELSGLLTDVVRRVRGRVGHPVACKVPITPETALGIGLDVKSWVEEGLISHLFLGTLTVSPDFDVPVERWKEIVGDIPVVVTLYSSWESGFNDSRTFTVEDARGLAAAAYWRGADGIQIFNFFKYLRGDIPDDLILRGQDPVPQRENQRIGRRLFNELHDPEALYSLPRRIYPGWNDSEIHIGDINEICRVAGYLDKWRQTHNDPEGMMPRDTPCVWKLWTAKVPPHDAWLVTDAEGPVKVNGHEVRVGGTFGIPSQTNQRDRKSLKWKVLGPDPVRIPKEWLKDGVTLVETSGHVSTLCIDL